MTIASPKAEQLLILDHVLEWLEVRANSGLALPSSIDELREAIDHSALLQRLLTGKRPLPNPPPLSFGQPWYQLSEEGFAECVVERQPEHLEINAAEWQIIDARGENEFVVRDVRDEATYLVWKMVPLSSGAPLASRWMIERL